MEYSVFPKKTGMLSGSEEIGWLECSYDRLVELFGQPLTDNTGSYVDVEWNICLENAHPIGIMNWKNGKKWLGQEAAGVEQLRKWRVAGHYPYDFEEVKKIVIGSTVLEFNAHLMAKNTDDLVKRLRSLANHIEEGKTASESSSDWHNWSLAEVPATKSKS